MHKIKTVLRLAGLGLSQRQIALSCQNPRTNQALDEPVCCGKATWRLSRDATT